MKLFATKQIAQIDRYTIEKEPISDTDLMERAALQITHSIIKNYSNESKMVFFAGPGNNGGDALAVARQLAELDYQSSVFLLDLGKKLKGSPAINWSRLEGQGKVKLNKIKTIEQFPQLEETDIVVDGLFGSGLSRPLEGLPAEIVQKINASVNHVIAIDIPSGLMGEDNAGNISGNIIRANHTLTLQFPKISFLFPENEFYTGRWEILPIGLHAEGIKNTPSDFVFIEAGEVVSTIKPRQKFSHKGTFGHALLIAGSYGKIGAAVLASRSCLRSGTGLLTTHVPRCGYTILQSAVPEAMVDTDKKEEVFATLPDLATFSAIGIGPGIGKSPETQSAFLKLLEKTTIPLVIDADGLNILSENPEWLKKLPENSILTPHPGEFGRLVGKTHDSWERLQIQIAFSKKYKVVLVVKGAYTTITDSGGKVYFNSTGNAGMATAGSGDVLTGIILGLLAQGISPEKAAITGVYLHGLAGDLAITGASEMALIAGDIVKNLGKAFLQLNLYSTK